MEPGAGSSGTQEVCKDHHEINHDLKVVVDDTGRTSVEPNSVVSSLGQKDQDTRLESTRTKMGQVREENERLKMYLHRIMKEYQTLEMKFHDIVHQEANNNYNDKNIHDQDTEEEDQLVSLSLGRVASDSRKEEKSKVSESSSSKQSLSLGLDSKLQTCTVVSDPSPANSLEELKDSKLLTNAKRSGDDEVSAQAPAAKKARVSVRARCDTPTMNDGCQWRKYGQKISKGNPCPRAYYRCTVAPNCPVRKQVQRCAQDMSILITTYEGNHNHPLSMSATAMASTTSAAACMLLSGSSSTTSAQLHGLNLNLSDPNNSHKSNLFLHNTSVSSSYPPSFPTITLDLTTSNNLNPSSSSHQLTRFNSGYAPRHSYPPTSLNFSSSEATAMDWGSGVLNYGSSTAHQQQYYTNSTRSQFGNLNYLGLGNGQPHNIYQSYMQQKTSTNPTSNQHYNLEAATKAITDDPTFQSVLAAALTSIISSGGGGGGGEQKMKWGEVFPAGDPSAAATSSGSGCASSYLLNRSSAVANPQRPGGLMFLQPSSPFSTPKSTSTSPSETRDHNS